MKRSLIYFVIQTIILFLAEIQFEPYYYSIAIKYTMGFMWFLWTIEAWTFIFYFLYKFYNFLFDKIVVLNDFILKTFVKSIKHEARVVKDAIKKD